MVGSRGRARAAALVLAALTLILSGCKKPKDEPGVVAGGPAAPAASSTPLELLVVYGSEKEAWFTAELTAFNATPPRLASGRVVRVSGEPMGSGEAMGAIIDGTKAAHVFSPASGAYLTLLNQAWQTRPGNLKPIAQGGEPLVLSPLVIGIWKPMAEALGWPQRPLGWSDLVKVARDPRGWGAFERPEWGSFKLGHTSPEYSTSGLLSVLAIAAAAKPAAGRGSVDVADPEVGKFLAAVEDSVVHYGKSTGFFANKMLARGPGYLSAAVLYENLVIESYARATPSELPLIALYPVEGTFWADHPYAILDAPWVSAEHREAAALLQRALRDRPAQERAVALGFRSSDPAIPVTSPIDAAHGVDPLQPQNLLDVPDAPTLSALVDLWRASKKAADVVLVFDKSGSMEGQALAEAKRGAKAFLAGLDPRDRVTLMFFDGRIYPAVGPMPAGAGRAELEARIDGVVAAGGTALYDAIAAAVAHLRKSGGSSHRIRAVVAMTDGIDENSRLKAAALRRALGREEDRISVFTVAYGANADAGILTSIADAANGSFSRGDVASIIQVFRDLAAYF